MAGKGVSEQRVYTEDEARERVAQELPRWTVEDGHLTRIYTTRNWRLSLMVANAIGFLAEAAWHHPDITISYPRVVVRLRTHEADGITDKDFALARLIEETVTWRPEVEDLFDTPPAPWIT